MGKKRSVRDNSEQPDKELDLLVEEEESSRGAIGPNTDELQRGASPAVRTSSSQMETGFWNEQGQLYREPVVQGLDSGDNFLTNHAEQPPSRNTPQVTGMSLSTAILPTQRSQYPHVAANRNFSNGRFLQSTENRNDQNQALYKLSGPNPTYIDCPEYQLTTSQHNTQVPHLTNRFTPNIRDRSEERSQTLNERHYDPGPYLPMNRNLASHQGERQTLQATNWRGSPDRLQARQNRTHRSTGSFDFKIPPFTGKEDWAVWVSRFEVIAERQQWSEDEMIDHLLPKLQGHAGEFVFTQLPRWMLYNFNHLMTELNNQFRVIDTQRSFAVKFSTRSQRKDEHVEEYAADLKRLYSKAYMHRHNSVRQEDLVRRFLDGLQDDEARFEVEFHKEPRDIDEAVFQVVRFIQTRQTRNIEQPYGDRKMRKFTRQLVEEEEDFPYESAESTSTRDSLDIRACRGKGIDQKGLARSDSKVEELEKEIASLKTEIEKMLSKMTQLTDGAKQQVSTRLEGLTCYRCGKKGHISRNCRSRPPYENEAQPRGHQDDHNRGIENRNRQESQALN